MLWLHQMQCISTCPQLTMQPSPHNRVHDLPGVRFIFLRQCPLANIIHKARLFLTQTEKICYTHLVTTRTVAILTAIILPLAVSKLLVLKLLGPLMWVIHFICSSEVFIFMLTLRLPFARLIRHCCSCKKSHNKTNTEMANNQYYEQPTFSIVITAYMLTFRKIDTHTYAS